MLQSQNRPDGPYSLTSSGTYTGNSQEYFSGILGLSVQVVFTYGSGGTSAKTYLQTSMDQAVTWQDVAAIGMFTTSTTTLLNLSKLTPVTTFRSPTTLALTTGTANDGVMGDRFRFVTVTVGTYANTTLTMSLVPS